LSGNFVGPNSNLFFLVSYEHKFRFKSGIITVCEHTHAVSVKNALFKVGFTEGELERVLGNVDNVLRVGEDDSSSNIDLVFSEDVLVAVVLVDREISNARLHQIAVNVRFVSVVIPRFVVDHLELRLFIGFKSGCAIGVFNIGFIYIADLSHTCEGFVRVCSKIDCRVNELKVLGDDRAVCKV
jgi:hypothetical protein